SGHAHPHTFRKTALQQAWVGDEKADEQVAQDAGVGRKVMLTHYVRVLREKSNRTFARILAGLPPEVARRGTVTPPPLSSRNGRPWKSSCGWRLRGRTGRQRPDFQPCVPRSRKRPRGWGG